MAAGVHVRGASGFVQSGDGGLDSDCLVVGGNRGEPLRLAHVQVTLLVGGERCGVGQTGRGLSVDDLDLCPVGSLEEVLPVEGFVARCYTPA